MSVSEKPTLLYL